MNTPLELVTWDLDGTLYDREALKRSVRQRLTKAVRPGSWRSARDAGRALRKHRVHEARVRAAGGVVDAAAAAFWTGPLWSAFLAGFFLPALAHIGPWPGVRRRLDRVAAAGVRQVVVSDYPVHDKLRALGLQDCFQGGFAGTEVGVLKPHPGLFRTVLGGLDVPAAAVLHVGDRPDTDGAAAASAGTRFAHVLAGDFVPVDAQLQAAGIPSN